MKTLVSRVFLAFLGVLTIVVAFAVPAKATGTVVIALPDGAEKTYKNVTIRIANESMAITSADGQGMLVLGKAACTKVGDLIECLPYDATLFQNGQRMHISLRAGGTVWLNLSGNQQHLSRSSTELPPRGVVLAVRTQRGAYVTLTGILDEVRR